ncbi:phosphotransferase [Acetobacter sp. TBRC 12305]|uniref:Phosphotransferase n=1 Tax=Acetobacter garciniae TaxID=2817435 RepID=A0A939HN93_9PROT|nr:phosphotransferase [Acetobacter garciniae]MBO1324798.1 phosphotransferase [Acetobacter garciniae]MBX0344489.1 phosphotransferase [Acetobacter garciniae]
MLDRAAILNLVPHQGASCLLDHCETWSDHALRAVVQDPCDPRNPLRRDGRLGPVVAAEIAMQAAALHGALTGRATGRPGYLAALRGLEILCDRLDHPQYGALVVDVAREHATADGLVYTFQVACAAGMRLASGAGTVLFPGMDSTERPA